MRYFVLWYRVVWWVVTDASEGHNQFKDHRNDCNRVLVQAVTSQRTVIFMSTGLLILTLYFYPLKSLSCLNYTLYRFCVLLTNQFKGCRKRSGYKLKGIFVNRMKSSDRFRAVVMAAAWSRVPGECAVERRLVEDSLRAATGLYNARTTKTRMRKQHNFLLR